MSDLKITNEGIVQTPSTQGPMNPVAAVGQVGSVFLDASGASSPPLGNVFIAITFLEDTVIDASGGLIAEDSTKYVNTEDAAHNLSDGSETSIEGSGGLQIDASNTFPQGVTIFGRWTEIDLTSGMIIAYIG